MSLWLLLLPHDKIFIILNLFSFYSVFVSLFTQAVYAVFVSLACKIELRDLSILLKLVDEQMCVVLDKNEPQVHLEEAEINLIANASKTKMPVAPAQKSKLDLAGSRKSLLIALVIQPGFISKQPQSHLSAV